MPVVASGLMLIGPQMVEWLAEQMGLGTVFVELWSWLRFPVAVLLLMVVVALIYYLFPNGDQPFRLTTPGAVLAVLVWIAASLGLSFLQLRCHVRQPGRGHRVAPLLLHLGGYVAFWGGGERGVLP